jgi:isoquinoline 1-oxidoreductase beta subunit
MKPASPGRRLALKSGAGAALALTLGFRVGAVENKADGNASFQPNAWLRIDDGGAVTVLISKTEIGQGTATGIAQIVADELDADWARVAVQTIRPDGKRMMVTGGSYSTAGAWDGGRKAAAAARHMLLQAGAQALGVEVAACGTAGHGVVHHASGRRVDYGKLVRQAAALPVPAAPVLKEAADLKLVGKPLAAKNLEPIVRAQAVYGLDVRVPGMVYAVIERSPVINGRVASVDSKAALKVAGVEKVVTLRGNTFPTLEYVRDGVAVVARSTWAALKGRSQLKVQWNDAWSQSKVKNGTLASSTELAADFDRALEGRDIGKAPHKIHAMATASRKGSADGMAAAFQSAAKTLELQYDVPLQAHVPLEPMNAVAHWTPQRCEVWAPCHAQSQLLDVLCEVTGLPPQAVIVNTPMVGGSFGRRLDADYAVEAVLLSRELGKPVQVVWTREDDIRYGLYAPPSRHKVRVALDGAGRILALDHAFAALSVFRQMMPDAIGADGIDYAAAIDAMKFPYQAPQLHVRHALVEQAIRVFWWRRGYTPNHTFVNECLLDECAHAAGTDPLQYRLSLLPPPQVLSFKNGEDAETIDTGRLANVLRLAAATAGWDQALPAGAGRGIASTVTDTYVAQVVEVTPHDGKLRVRRVVTVVDCGRVVNPQLVQAQVEGSIVFALTAALKGAITVEQGRIQQSNFHDYPLLRIDEMPLIETVLVDSTAAPTGIGEPASHAVAAALSNAIFAASGKRWRSTPMQA